MQYELISDFPLIMTPINSGLRASYLAFANTSDIDHRVDCCEIWNKHCSRLIEAEAIWNSHANSRQGRCVRGEGVFSAKENDTIANLKVIRANICSHTSDDSSGLDAEETDRKFNNTQCNRNILRTAC